VVDIDVFVDKTYPASTSFNEFPGPYAQLPTTMFDPDASLQYSTFRSYTERHLN
jgi:hypothetical protein